MKTLAYSLLFCALLGTGFAQSTTTSTSKTTAKKKDTTATSTSTTTTTSTTTRTTETDANPGKEKTPEKEPEETASQPFLVPTWLLFVFGIIVIGQVYLGVKYYALKGDISMAIESGIEPVTSSLDTVTQRIAELRHDIGAIRRGQESVLSLAMNRVTAGSQFPFGPQVRQMTPERGKLDGGTRVEIRGRNFSPDAEVWFGGSRADVLPTSTTERLDVSAPPGGGGEVDVYVVNANGVMSQQRSFHYRYIDFHLNDVPAPAGGRVNLTGAGFTDATRVLIDGNDAGQVTFTDATAINVAVPGGLAAGPHRMIAVNPGNDRSAEKTFQT